MASKKLFGIFAGIFIALMLAGLGSAKVTFEDVIGAAQTAEPGEQIAISFNVTASGHIGQFNNATLILPNLFGSGIGIWTGDTGTFTLLPESKVFRSLTLTIPTNQAPGTYNGFVNFTGNYNLTTSPPNIEALPVSIIIKEEPQTPLNFCRSGVTASGTNNLSIDRISVDNLGEGSDEEWRLLDNVDIEVRVDNIGDDDLDDVIVEMGLFDGSGNNVVNDLDFEDSDEEKQDLGRIRDGDDATANFKFKIPADFEDRSYTLIFKAYQDGDEDEICVEEEHDEKISVERETDEDKSVIVDEISMPLEVVCGEVVSGSATVFNIGEDDYNDQILIRIFNTELGIDEKITLRGDLDVGDDKDFDFSFALPATAESKTYPINFETRYDWDEDTEAYDLVSDDPSQFLMRVIGCSTPTGSGPLPDVVVTANQQSEAKAGEEFTVKVDLANLGTQSKNLILSVSGFESWAEFGTLSNRIFSVDSASSASSTITFKVKPGVTGRQIFTLEIAEGTTTKLQEIEVTVLEESGGFNFDFGNSGLLWVIGAVNLILIILIIIVAVRLSRR